MRWSTSSAGSIREAVAEGGNSDFWTISLSDDLILSGLIAGELFLIWNNGLRQGLRGHSIGKHRVGLAVVDVGDGAPTGAARGILRGVIMAVLLDLAVAAIPIGLPTVFRRLTPESWHFGGAAYLALIVLVVPLFLSSNRGFADRIARTKVVRGTGAEAMTTWGASGSWPRSTSRAWSGCSGWRSATSPTTRRSCSSPRRSDHGPEVLVLSTSCILMSRDIRA